MMNNPNLKWARASACHGGECVEVTRVSPEQVASLRSAELPPCMLRTADACTGEGVTSLNGNPACKACVWEFLNAEANEVDRG